jgi:hypothetical protein
MDISPDEQDRATRSDTFLSSQEVEKKYFRFADRIRDLENEPGCGWSKKTDLMGRIAKLLRDKPFPSCKAICR